MKFDVDKIKAQNDIVSVADRLGIRIHKDGHQYAIVRCFRPERHAHGDRTPSSVLDKERQVFRCWVCDEKSLDAIALVQAVLGIDFPEACEWLTGGKVLTAPKEEKKYSTFVAKRTCAESKIVKEALSLFLSMCDPEAEEMFSYMEGRGISRELVRRQKLVYCRDYHKINRAMKEAYTVLQLKMIGLISQNNEKGNLMPFGNRVIYPFYHRDEVVYIQGRSIEADAGLRKLSQGGTIPCFYNVNCLKAAEKVMLCEGVEDTLSAMEMGWDAVGILGVKGLKTRWIKALRGKKVFVVMDNDNAGQTADGQIRKMLKEHGVRSGSFTKKMPEGFDLNDYLKEKKKNVQMHKREEVSDMPGEGVLQ